MEMWEVEKRRGREGRREREVVRGSRKAPPWM